MLFGRAVAATGASRSDWSATQVARRARSASVTGPGGSKSMTGCGRSRPGVRRSRAAGVGICGSTVSTIAHTDQAAYHPVLQRGVRRLLDHELQRQGSELDIQHRLGNAVDEEAMLIDRGQDPEGDPPALRRRRAGVAGGQCGGNRVSIGLRDADRTAPPCRSGIMPSPCRSNSAPPSDASSLWICSLSAGWLIFARAPRRIRAEAAARG